MDLKCDAERVVFSAYGIPENTLRQTSTHEGESCVIISQLRYALAVPTLSSQQFGIFEKDCCACTVQCRCAWLRRYNSRPYMYLREETKYGLEAKM